MTEAMKTLVQKVTSMQGCKAIDLVVALTTEDPKTHWHNILEQAVGDRNIKVINYVLPDMKYRTKSFILPKDTNIEIL